MFATVGPFVVVVAGFVVAAVVVGGGLVMSCWSVMIGPDGGFARSIGLDVNSSWLLCCALLVGFVARYLLLVFHRFGYLLGCLDSGLIGGSSQIDFFKKGF